MPTSAQIQAARKGLGLSQAAAAALIDVSRVTWARWESGITSPPSSHLWAYWLHVAGIERIPFRKA